MSVKVYWLFLIASYYSLNIPNSLDCEASCCCISRLSSYERVCLSTSIEKYFLNTSGSLDVSSILWYLSHLSLSTLFSSLSFTISTFVTLSVCRLILDSWSYWRNCSLRSSISPIFMAARFSAMVTGISSSPRARLSSLSTSSGVLRRRRLWLSPS